MAGGGSKIGGRFQTLTKAPKRVHTSFPLHANRQTQQAASAELSIYRQSRILTADQFMTGFERGASIRARTACQRVPQFVTIRIANDHLCPLLIGR